MTKTSSTDTQWTTLLRSKASHYAIRGALIAAAAVIIATFLISYIRTGGITPVGIILAQSGNPAMWILDLMPLIFGFWGQYASHVMTATAQAIINEETDELRTETTALESKIIHTVLHDPTTDLPNRVLLLDRLKQTINQSKQSHKPFTIMMVNLNQYTEINNTIGHRAGDALIKETAKRLENLAGNTNTVARFGGGEFALLFPNLSTLENAKGEATHIRETLLEPFEFGSMSIGIQTAIGIALYPKHGKNPDILLQSAQSAMDASIKGKADFTCYSPDIDELGSKRLIIMSELRKALKNNRLEMHYQPKIDLKTNQIYGAEALIRWKHEEYGNIPPAKFIPFAEETGMTKEVTRWVLNRCIEQRKTWRELGITLAIAFNISGIDMLDGELMDEIKDKLYAENAADDNSMTVEVTETAFIEDQERATSRINQMTSKGIHFSIDDFGTGYSSLTYLSQLLVHELKIDASFTGKMLESPADKTIVKATIDLAHSLKLKVVAEGIEDKKTLAAVKKLGCDYAQGFYFSPALDPQEFAEWLKTWQASHPPPSKS